MAASAPSSSKLQCIICPRQFPGLEDLKCHVAGEHLDYFPVGCGHCNTWLPAESMLKVHVDRRGHLPYKAKFLEDQRKEAQLSAMMKQITETGATPRQPLQQQQQSDAENSAFKPPNRPTSATASAASAMQKTPVKSTMPNTVATAATIQQLQQADIKIKQFQDAFIHVQQVGPNEAAKQHGLPSGDALLATLQTNLRVAQANRDKIAALLQQQPQKPKSAPRPRAAPKTEGGAAKGRKRKSDSAVDAKTPADAENANTPGQAAPSGVPSRPASTAPSETPIPAIATAPPTIVAPQPTLIEPLQSVAAPQVATAPLVVTIESIGSVPNPVAETKGCPMPSTESSVGMPSLISQMDVSGSSVDAKASANTLTPAPAVPSGFPSHPVSVAPSETPTPPIVIAPPAIVAPQQMITGQVETIAAPAVATAPPPATIVVETPNTPLPSIEDTFGRGSLVSQVVVSDSAMDTKTLANTVLASTITPAPAVPYGVPSIPASNTPTETPSLTTASAPSTTVAPQQMPTEQLLSVAAPPVSSSPQLAAIESVPNQVAEMPNISVSSIEDASGKSPSTSQVAVSEPSFSTDGSCYSAPPQ